MPGLSVSSGLDRVREVARKDKDARFTALLHHVDFDRLWEAYWAIRPLAAPGIDGVTWDSYGEDLEANLQGLLARVNSGAYRAKSVSQGVHREGGRAAPAARHRHAGGQDPQRAVVEVLNAIYEEDFLGLFLRVPTRAPPARCARRPHGRDRTEKGELGA